MQKHRSLILLAYNLAFALVSMVGPRWCALGMLLWPRSTSRNISTQQLRRFSITSLEVPDHTYVPLPCYSLYMLPELKANLLEPGPSIKLIQWKFKRRSSDLDNYSVHFPRQRDADICVYLLAYTGDIAAGPVLAAPSLVCQFWIFLLFVRVRAKTLNHLVVYLLWRMSDTIALYRKAVIEARITNSLNCE